MKLSQSNVIFFCLFAAFVIFITLRGELPKYLAVLFTTQATGSGTSSGGGGGGADVGATAAQAVQDPIGAATGALRRGLGIGNGILPNLGSILGF